MTTVKAEHLREVRTLNDVLGLLADDLDWPIGVDDLEEATFDWSPGELGIPAERVPHLQSLRQLRPLTTHQPWGIFFLEFDGPRLPLTALRRLLDKLVTKQRATGGALRTWRLDDLLFIVTTSSGESVELHFLALFDDPGHASAVRSIPWRPLASPAQHLRRVATELLPHLAWPDDTDDVEEWREEWRSAFRLLHGEAIASAQRLAERMAEIAHALRREIELALAHEKGRGPFSSLMGDVRDQLVGSVSPDSFADMCAQTLVYGLLSSRITDPAAFGASPAFTGVPLSNPFLSAFFEDVHDQASALDLDGIGLEQLVADLRETNVEAILDQFGATAYGGDPVIHFYEQFLQSYDRRMRADAGAFYTPQPVVEFMVRTVDAIMRDRFGLPAGIADAATWAEVAARKGFAVPNGVDPSDAFVSMIDPATGTGTFVVEWLRRARKSFQTSDLGATWADHAKATVLPGVNAFELMLAPYTIAHLKVALELHDEGLGDQAPTILLTDTLDYDSHSRLFEDNPVSHEGERAAELKESKRFTVTIGNPPYDREQRDSGSSSRRKGGIARFGVPGVPPLMKSVLEPLTAAGLGKHAKNAYNDYVYFWTWSTWQSVTRRDGPGVVALITASSYLDGVSLGGLRSHLRDVFDELWVVDLGGEGRGARTDENVFAIRTPVAIAFGVRTGDRSESCAVRYVKVDGSRMEKLAKMAVLNPLDAEGVTVHGSGLDRLTPVSDAQYNDWPKLMDLMPASFPGVKAGRTWVIAPTRSVLERRLTELLSHTAKARTALFKDSPTGRKTTDPLGRTIMPGRWESTSVARLSRNPGLARYGYRSLDRQWIVADPRFLDRASAAWSVDSVDQVFLTTLTSTRLGAGPLVFASALIPDLHHFRGSYGARDVIPLYRDAGTSPNVASGLLDVLSNQLGEALGVASLVEYIYGLLGTGAFATRFEGELGESSGSVRVPITADIELFVEAAAIGRELLWLHTWGERFGDGGTLPQPTASELQRVGGSPERFAWDSKTGTISIGDGAIGPVSEAVWSFEVSGLKVLQSWLGNRMHAGKGKRSSLLDEIRPERWTFTQELLTLTAILERTLALTPLADNLLTRILDSPLIDSDLLPSPTDIDRKLTTDGEA